MSAEHTKKSRLSAVAEKAIEPFARAQQVEDISIYWLPIAAYPMRIYQRTWLEEFQTRLANQLLTKHKLREETFLRFKSIYPDLNDLFTRTALEYAPMLGGGVGPDAAMPEPITLDALKKQVDDAGKNGGMVDVHRWMPDIVYWFAKKKPQEQRRNFLGYGGLTTLYLAPDEATTSPILKLPKLFTTAPGFDQAAAQRLQQEMQFAYSLKDSFLPLSKEIFGEPYRNDPSYRGLLFVIPLFTAGALLSATAEQRTEWAKVFEGYMTESMVDKGVLLLMNTPDFDEELTEILRVMVEDGFVYRN